VYPPTEVLEEVGRVTIAGAILDLEMGLLWLGLDRSNVDEEKARKATSREQVRQVRKLAEDRLDNPLREQVVHTASLVGRVMKERNEVVHRSWLLRGRDANRPVGEIPTSSLRELRQYLDAWSRTSMPSDQWETVESQTIQVTRVSTDEMLRQLIRVERRLDRATLRVISMQFRVGSALG
jgi:hypothetical protein